MPKLEIRVVLTDSDGDEHTCDGNTLVKLLAVCIGMARFNDRIFKPHEMWVEGNHNLAVGIDKGQFYISFEDAEAYVKLIEEHLTNAVR